MAPKKSSNKPDTLIPAKVTIKVPNGVTPPTESEVVAILIMQVVSEYRQRGGSLPALLNATKLTWQLFESDEVGDGF